MPAHRGSPDVVPARHLSSRGSLASRRRHATISLGFGLLAIGATLAGCQQGMEAAGRKVDAPGVPVAFVGVEGAPEALQAQVNETVVAQATARRIDIVDAAGEPRYRLKGYLTAYPSEGGQTKLTFVWDVFDASRRRAQRISTTTTTPGRGADPWEQVGEAQIQAVASRSMNDVAAFLAGSGRDGAGPANGTPQRALALSAD